MKQAWMLASQAPSLSRTVWQYIPNPRKPLKIRTSRAARPQDRERNQRAVPPLDFGGRRHGMDDVANLLNVGIRAGRVALAIRVSFAERLKYSASE
jgi:hypothetical protein